MLRPLNYDENVKELLVRLSVVSFVLLALTLVLFFWVMIRLLRSKFKPQSPAKETPYVDAWKVAGERFQLDASDEREED